MKLTSVVRDQELEKKTNSSDLGDKLLAKEPIRVIGDNLFQSNERSRKLTDFQIHHSSMKRKSISLDETRHQLSSNEQLPNTIDDTHIDSEYSSGRETPSRPSSPILGSNSLRNGGDSAVMTRPTSEGLTRHSLILLGDGEEKQHQDVIREDTTSEEEGIACSGNPSQNNEGTTSSHNALWSSLWRG